MTRGEQLQKEITKEVVKYSNELAWDQLHDLYTRTAFRKLFAYLDEISIEIAQIRGK